MGNFVTSSLVPLVPSMVVYMLLKFVLLILFMPLSLKFALLTFFMLLILLLMVLKAMPYMLKQYLDPTFVKLMSLVTLITTPKMLMLYVLLYLVAVCTSSSHALRSRFPRCLVLTADFLTQFLHMPTMSRPLPRPALYMILRPTSVLDILPVALNLLYPCFLSMRSGRM